MTTTDKAAQAAPETTNGTEPAPKHGNVTEALAAVMADLPGIDKGGRADPAQGGYSYRGIEQITQAAQPILARHGVVPYPRVTQPPVITSITVNGKPWTDTMLTVEYRFKHGPSDTEEVVGPLIGIGRDNSDKGANKAMTQVYKYALIQVLCIGDKADDADGTSQEADAQGPPWWEPLGYADEDQAKATNDSLKAVFDTIAREGREKIKPWLKEHKYTTWLPVKLDDAPDYGKLLTSLATEHPISADEPGTGEAPDAADTVPEQAPELPQPEAAQPPPPGPAKAPAAVQAAKMTMTPEERDAGEAATEADQSVDAITAQVKAMKPAELDAALVRRGKSPEGKALDKQKLLAAVMVQEAAERRQRGGEEF